MQFERKENENSTEYLLRLVGYKLEEKPSDLEWQDIVDYCGLNCHYDSLRKAMQPEEYGAHAIYKYMLENGISDEKYLKQLEKKKIEIYQEQVKARDQKRELRSYWTLDARAQHLKSVMTDCAIEISNSNPYVINKIPIESNDQVMVVALNDWHYVEQTTNFLNIFDKKEFNRRIDIMFNSILDRCKKEGIRNLKLLNVGDLISGYCKVGIRVANEENIIEQIMQVSEVLATLLTNLCENNQIDKVEFYSVNDNHSRATQNIKNNIEAENFGRLIPWYLETRMENVNNFELVENRIDGVKELNIGICPIFNEQIFFVHGHLDKPATVIQDLTLMTRRFPVSVLFGHLHNNFESEVHSIDLIGLPSLIGTADYALGIRKTSLPRQKMIVYSNGSDGKVRRESTHFINLN